MKYQYTFKNHFRFGYTPAKYFSLRSSPQEKFIFEYGRAQKNFKNWRQANVKAAQSIREHFGPDLWVLFSGGTDSECCIISFIEAGIPIKIATLRMEEGLNSHDLAYVHHFSQKHDLSVEYFDLNVKNFIQSGELFQYTDPIQCVSPILACHLWLADQIPGVPIIAQGECHLKKKIPEGYVPGVSPYEPSDWYLTESERLCSLYMHFILKGQPAVPGFFQYCPEQIHSFLRYNPILRNLVHNQVPGKLGTRSSKNKMIHQFYPEIDERPKYTGFENLEEIHEKYRKILADRYPHSDDHCDIDYTDVVKMVEPNFI